MIRVRALAFAAAVLTLSAGGALAQQTERDDRRIDRMERTVREIERIVRQGAASGRPVVVAPETLPGEIESLRSRLDDLQASQQSLNSTVEALTNELNQARRATTAAQSEARELQQRLLALEARPAAAPVPPEPVEGKVGPEEVGDAAAAVRGAAAAAAATEGPRGVTPAGAGDPARAFQRARQQLLEGDYASASTAFNAFVRPFPRTPARRKPATGSARRCTSAKTMAGRRRPISRR
jgi:TolA-binding protein